MHARARSGGCTIFRGPAKLSLSVSSSSRTRPRRETTAPTLFSTRFRRVMLCERRARILQPHRDRQSCRCSFLSPCSPQALHMTVLRLWELLSATEQAAIVQVCHHRIFHNSTYTPGLIGTLPNYRPRSQTPADCRLRARSLRHTSSYVWPRGPSSSSRRTNTSSPTASFLCLSSLPPLLHVLLSLIRSA